MTQSKVRDTAVVAEAHDRALAVVLFDLREDLVKRPLFFVVHSKPLDLYFFQFPLLNERVFYILQYLPATGHLHLMCLYRRKSA